MHGRGGGSLDQAVLPCAPAMARFGRIGTPSLQPGSVAWVRCRQSPVKLVESQTRTRHPTPSARAFLIARGPAAGHGRTQPPARRAWTRAPPPQPPPLPPPHAACRWPPPLRRRRPLRPRPRPRRPPLQASRQVRARGVCLECPAAQRTCRLCTLLGRSQRARQAPVLW